MLLTPATARSAAGAGRRRSAGTHLRLDRRRRARLRRDRDRRLRRADRLRHRDAAGLRPRHGRRPLRLAAWRARRPAGGARARRAPRRQRLGSRSPPPRIRREARPGLLLAVFLVACGRITLNSVATETAGSEGLEVGDALPPFAMPLSTSAPRPLRRQRRHAGPPGPGARVRPARCAGRVLNSCELAEGGPVVLAFVFERSPAAGSRSGRPPPVASRHRDVTSGRRRARRRRRRARWLAPSGRLRQRRRGRNLYAGVSARRSRTCGAKGRSRARASARSTRTPSRGGWLGLRAEPPIVVGPPDRALIDVRLVRCGLLGRAQPTRRSLARAAPSPARSVGPPRRRPCDHPGHARDPRGLPDPLPAPRDGAPQSGRGADHQR